ncbi:MAG: hypothetical protein K2J67_08000 [Lachnospiraceae bacterium]|nr:hypothetical protein [Lachnospiraceae bacterium]
MIRKRLILCLILCLVLLSACEKTDKTIQKDKNKRTTEMPAEQNGVQKDNTTKVGKVIQKDNGIYFANTLEDFIHCYNANYYDDNGTNYIQPYSEWYSYVQDFGRHKGEMCFYTLKVFFSDMDEKELTKLYKELNEKAYANIFQNEQGFHSDNPPSDLYFKNAVGVYPYFAYGESVRMCIIPVTKKVMKLYKKKGVKIHKI